MTRIFLDTNFIIDYFIREDYSGNAEKVIRLGNSRNMEFCISYLTVANFAYIMRKMPADKLRELIHKICISFTIISNTKDQILRSMQNPVADFEDGLQHQSAVDAKCDFIITRNKKDFPVDTVPVITPAEFISLF